VFDTAAPYRAGLTPNLHATGRAKPAFFHQNDSNLLPPLRIHGFSA